MNTTRLERVRGLMRRRRLEQLIITQPQSIYYLTGEWVAPMDRLDALIITGDDVRMLCYNLAVIEPENCKTVIYSDMGRALPCLMELMERVPTGIDGGMAARFCLPLIEAMPEVRFTASYCVDAARMICDALKDRVVIHMNVFAPHRRRAAGRAHSGESGGREAGACGHR